MIYKATDFDERRTADYTLLVGVGATSHKLIVIDPAQQLKFAASYTPENTDPEITDLLNRDFDSVKLAISDARYSLVPVDVYDKRYHEVYLRYLPFDGVGTTQVADVAPLGVKLLHQVNRLGWESLITRFPDAESYPMVQALLMAIAGYGMQTREPLVFIERHAPWVTVAVFDEGRLLYCHDFTDGHVDDVAYHLLSVVNSFGLHDRPLSLLLSGDIDRNDVYAQRVATYSENVVLADSNVLLGVQVPNGIVAHQQQFFTLFGLQQCVS